MFFSRLPREVSLAQEKAPVLSLMGTLRISGKPNKMDVKKRACERKKERKRKLQKIFLAMIEIDLY